MKEVWRSLEDLEIRPFAYVTDEDAGIVDGLLEVSTAVEAVAEPEVVETPSPVAADEPAADLPSVGDYLHIAADGSLPTETAQPGKSALQPYVVFAGSTAPVATADREQIIAGLVDVVRTEGPVLGQRLRLAYVQASGGKRVGRAIASILDSALAEAVHQGRLVEDNPLHEPGFAGRTFRLDDQPTSRLRATGPRTLHEIPPRELADVVR